MASITDEERRKKYMASLEAMAQEKDKTYKVPTQLEQEKPVASFGVSFQDADIKNPAIKAENTVSAPKQVAVDKDEKPKVIKRATTFHDIGAAIAAATGQKPAFQLESFAPAH